jgi:hypothetical protein
MCPPRWLTPVYGALYPERSQWTAPETYRHLGTTGRTTVFDFPPEREDAGSVCPGLHRTTAGNRVFWFDPRLLPQVGEALVGLHRSEMLNGTESQRQAGFAAWNEWQEKRDYPDCCRQRSHNQDGSSQRSTFYAGGRPDSV